jgi:phosphotransferase system IIB component
MIPIDPTYDPEGNELADQIIQERSCFAQLRVIVNDMTHSQKMAVAQIACNQMAGSPSNQLIQLKPIGGEFDDQIKAAFVLLGALPLEKLAQVAIEILEKFTDPNE